MPYVRRLPSGKWQATVRTLDGRRRTRTHKLRSVVKEWAAEQESAMRRGEWADPRAGRLTVGEWWPKWLATKTHEEATLAKYESHWRAHIEDRWSRVPLAAVTAWDYEAWIATMRREHVGGHALAQSARLLHYLLADAARVRLVATDPTAGARIPAPPRHVDRFLTFEEFARLRAHLPTERDRALATLMAYAGLRWAEAAALTGERVDLGARRILVSDALRRRGTVKAPKSAAGFRYVPVVPEVDAALAPLLAPGRLFPGIDYTNWRRRVWLPAVERAQLAGPQPTPHDLRHTFGSWLAQAGVPPVQIQGYLGHSTLRATERYMHARPGADDAMLAALAVRAEITAG
jgi:integrase